MKGSQINSAPVAIDSYTVRHLDAWLADAINGDIRRAAVRARMLAFIADNDPEYWGSQSWWNVFDRSGCDDILRGEG